MTSPKKMNGLLTMSPIAAGERATPSATSVPPASGVRYLTAKRRARHPNGEPKCSSNAHVDERRTAASSGTPQMNARTSGSSMNDEVFSGIKVLVALAKADGTIHDDERIAIESALDGADLPNGQTVASLLAAEIDLTVELARITSKEARERTYAAACAIVYVDGHVSLEEQRMLARVGAAFGLSTAGTAEVFAKFTSVTPPSTLEKVDDAAERERVLTEEIASGASFSAVLASTSLPIAAESCLFTNNVRVARNIGLVYGHDADDAFWRTFVGNVVGAAASWFAISSLLKLIPGSGSAASAAYASTFALGSVTRLYFDKGEDVPPSALRDAFVTAKREGQRLALGAAAAIAARRERLDAAKASLDAQLASGDLTDLAYANKLVTLA